MDRLIDAEIRDRAKLDEEIERFWQREDLRQQGITRTVAACAFFLFGIAFGVLSLPGCATDPASKARQVVSGMYTGIGAASVAGLTCNATARTLGDMGNLDAANKAYRACETLNASLHVAVNAADATVHSIDAGEAIGSKDFGAALLPLYQAGCDLQKAISMVATEIGHAIPVVLPCGGK